MAKITNKDYITISRDGVFVGGKPATKYHGKPIAKLQEVGYVFFMSAGLETIKEIHVLQSSTEGTVFEAGNPEPAKDGGHVWIQAVTETGTTPWIYRLGGNDGKDIASLCAFQCAWTLNQYPSWVKTLLKFANKSDAMKQGTKAVETLTKVNSAKKQIRTSAGRGSK